jgi:hypothetical protein
VIDRRKWGSSVGRGDGMGEGNTSEDAFPPVGEIPHDPFSDVTEI